MPYDRSIDVMIGRLRQKLEKDARKPELIKTVRNQGYVLFPVKARWIEMSIRRIVNWVLMLILLLFTVQTIVIVYAVHSNQNAQDTEQSTGKIGQISSIIETVLTLDEVSLGVMVSLQPFSDFNLVYPAPEGLSTVFPPTGRRDCWKAFAGPGGF